MSDRVTSFVEIITNMTLLATVALAAEIAVHTLMPARSTWVELYTPDASAKGGLKHLGTTMLLVSARPDAVVFTLPPSTVFGLGLYLDRETREMTMPQIGSSKAPVIYRGTGLRWHARREIDKRPQSRTGSFGDVRVHRLAGKPDACALSASFSKVVQGRTVIAEELVAHYPCPTQASTH